MHVRNRQATAASRVTTVVLATALAACGGGGQEVDTEADAGSDAPATTAEAAESTEPVEADAEPGVEDCAVDAAMVSSVTGIEMALSNTSTAIDEGFTCVFGDASDQTMAMASVTVGNWDGSEATAESITSTTTEFLGEPTGRPDVGAHAYLWNADDGATHTLTVFVDDQYVTTTLDGLDAGAADREAMLLELYEAAVG